MSKTLTMNAVATISYAYRNVAETGITQESRTFGTTTAFTNGKANNQVDIMFRRAYTVTAGSPHQDLVLRGVLEDAFFDILDFETVRVIQIKNNATAAGDTIYFGALDAANPLLEPFAGVAGGGVSVKAGGCFQLVAPIGGYAVSETAKTLRIAYEGTSGSIAVEVVIAGTSGDLVSSSTSRSSSSSLSLSSSSSHSLSSWSTSSSIIKKSSSSSSTQSKSSSSLSSKSSSSRSVSSSSSSIVNKSSSSSSPKSASSSLSKSSSSRSASSSSIKAKSSSSSSSRSKSSSSLSSWSSSSTQSSASSMSTRNSSSSSSPLSASSNLVSSASSWSSVG